MGPEALRSREGHGRGTVEPGLEGHLAPGEMEVKSGVSAGSPQQLGWVGTGGQEGQQ